MKIKHILATFLVAVLMASSLSSLTTVVAAESKNTDSTVITDNETVTLKEVEKDSVVADLYDNKTNTADQLEVLPEEDEMVRVIIMLKDDSVLEKDAKASLNVLTKLQMYLIEAKQNRVLSKIEKKVFDGEELNVRYQYTWLLNGIATTVPYGKIQDIEKISGVDKVLLQPMYELDDEVQSVNARTMADGSMIGREDTWASGYTGKGIKIAIIDTGLDDDHQNFQAMPAENLTEESATKDTVASVLGRLNATELYPNLTVDQVYRSNKVAFGFNYVDQNTIINHSKDSQGDHGTHVAGIAAANDLGNGEAVGVAPDAQLYVMKIFGANGGAYAEDILASIEDALLLDADVINMSLGSNAGFTSDGEEVDAIYARVGETNTILAVAAGNSATAGAGNAWGTDTNSTSNPDNSIISSPATYQNVTSVASIENVAINTNYVEVNGSKFAYIEASDGANESISTLFDQEYDYAMVDNFGMSLEDFTNAEVEGKVAVVQRGTTNFTAKHELAQEAGAVACIIYNNTAGSLSMGLTDGTGTIPCVSIGMSAGEYLAAQKEADPTTKLSFPAKKALIENEDGNQMSSFTSWGPSPDLKLEPDITGPGGNIYSTLDGGTYGIMSGTSMATPNVAGISALVMQYAKTTHPDMKEDELHDYVNALLLSTSVPAVYDGETGLTYSPRQQGSGLANAYNATKTEAYLSVDGNEMPKAELYDDVEKTGKYAFTYHVNNFGDHTIYYSLSTNAQTEDVDDYGEGYLFMSSTPKALDAATSETSKNLIYTYDYDGNAKTDSHDARELYLISVLNKKEMEENASFRYEVDTKEGSDKADVQAYLDALVGKDSEADLSAQVLKVEAGKTVDVNVKINLTDTDKEYFAAYYENGGYVEGFTNLTARSNGDVDLSMPYLGFYGDWTEAPIIDYGYYWDDSETANANQYWNMIWTSIQGSDWMPGLNPYLSDEPFDPENITMSPNGDGITDSIDDIYVSLMRNANTVQVSFEDAKDGTVYYDETYDKVQKTYYYSAAGSMLPFIQSQYAEEMYGFTDQNGDVLPNDTVVTMKIKATLDYDRHESNNDHDTWEQKFIVDTEAPKVLNAEVVKEDGRQYLDLTFQDNQKVAAVCFLNKAGAVVKARYGVDAKAGEEVTERYDITGYGNEFMIVLGDYAVNETYYKVETTDNIPEVNKDLMYAYRVATDSIYDDTLYGWVAVDPANKNEDGTAIVVQEQDSEYYVDYSLQAAEYIDGHILAVDAGGQLVHLTPGVWDDRIVIAEYDFEIKDMTYDPVDQVLYGYTGGTDGTYQIVKIDIKTGELTSFNKQYIGGTNQRPFALACDKDGILYGIDSVGQLKTIDKTTGRWNQEVLLKTGLTPMNVQTMTYKAADNSIYWAAYLEDESSCLYKIDLSNNYELTKVGSFDDNPELNGLIVMDDKGYVIPEQNAESIQIADENVAILTGKSTDLAVKSTPWYGNTGELTWTSSDEHIASVDIKGTVTGKKEGTVTITVTNDQNLKAECTVRVIQPKSDLYGFTIGSGAGYANQWLNVKTENLKQTEPVSDLSWVTYAAAEYYDGSIYAFNNSTEFYRIDPTNYQETKISNPNSMWSMKDMAYDYSTGYMFGIATKVGSDGLTYLVHIDLQTGLIEQVGESPLYDVKDGQPIALAISTEGTIYIITDTGYLCECTGDRTVVGGQFDGDYGIGGDDWLLSVSEDSNAADGTPLELKIIGVTGESHLLGLTSMAYDHNTGHMYYTYANTIEVEQLALVDTITGKALTLGSVAGGSQLIGLYAVPDEIPERPEVPVTDISATEESVNLVTGMEIAAPINIQPFNATDRTVTYECSEDGIIKIEDNVIKAVKKGTTQVTAKVGDFKTEFTVRVYESAGEMRGFIVYDLLYEDTYIWASIKDSDLTTGTGLANADNYSIDAAEYYNGKIYAYDNMNATFLVLDAKSNKYEVEKRCTLDDPYPDMSDLAFDYSEGVMYGLSSVRNTDTYTTLYAVNIEDGTSYRIGSQSVTMKAMTCSTDGILYGVDSDGKFYQIDKETGKETYLFDTGHKANLYQSMSYDHNTGNIYWAQIYWSLEEGTDANLMLIDPEQGVSVSLGQIGAAGCQVTGLYVEPKTNIPVNTPEVKYVKLDTSNMMLAVGETKQISAFTQPYSVALKDVKFEYLSIDENIITVDENGKVTAVGEGETFLAVSCNGIEGVCKVTVLGDSNEFYVLNADGYQTSPVLNPSKISGEEKLSAHDTDFRIEKATLHSDGYFYAIGTDGYLWKFTADMKQIEKIGEEKVLEQLSNGDDLWWASSSTVRTLVSNTFNGKLYTMVYCIGDFGNGSYLYEIDTETGAAVLVRQIPEEVTLPTAFTFDSPQSMIVYDGNMDYIYRVALNVSGGDEDIDGDFGIDDDFDFGIGGDDDFGIGALNDDDIDTGIDDGYVGGDFGIDDNFGVDGDFGIDDNFGVDGDESGIPDCEQIVWVQGTVVATEDIAMYYSSNLNRVFMTTTNDSPYVNTKTIDLYVLNLEDNSFEKYGQASYNQDVKGLVMLEGGIVLKEGKTEQEPMESVTEPETTEETPVVPESEPLKEVTVPVEPETTAETTEETKEETVETMQEEADPVDLKED